MDGSVLAGVSLTTTSTDVSDVLSHYGIKGMKWGVRRANPSASVPASEDAKAHKETRAQIKTSGTKSLSNKELKDFLERMDLEKRYNKANPTKTAQAKKAVKELLLQVGKQELGKALAKEVAKKLARTG